jgi:hypothetical protein
MWHLAQVEKTCFGDLVKVPTRGVLHLSELELEMFGLLAKKGHNHL